MHTLDDIVPIVRENLEAYNSGDRDRFRATLHDDAIWRTPVHELAGTDEVWCGPQAIIDGAWRERDTFPDLRGEITNAFTGGDQGVLEMVWRGTHRQTQRCLIWPECFVYGLCAGKIISGTIYITLVGAAPSAHS